jgi:hypothetical protein
MVNAISPTTPIQTCSICHEDLDHACTENPTYTLPECNHTFHAACSVQWFRQGRTNCPLCNNVGTVNDEFRDTRTYFSKAITMARKSSASPEMKNHYTRIQKLKQKIVILNQEKKEINESVGVYKEISKKYSANRVKYWNSKHALWKEMRLLTALLPTTINVILPIRVNVGGGGG